MNAARIFFRSYIKSLVRRQENQDLFHALRDVTLRVERGEGVAIIGRNGAGKSTLLSLIAGISCADSGTVHVEGRVAALLELGSGFHPDLTGRENVRLYASLLGLSEQETNDRYGQIVEFSGLEDFIHEPLRAYSTGMVMRLAFSVAVAIQPDILVVDEAFAVGDQAFQQKCVDRLLELRAAGTTMLCVSHSTEILKQLCTRAVWLDHGRVMLEGPIDVVAAAYEFGSPASTRV